MRRCVSIFVVILLILGAGMQSFRRVRAEFVTLTVSAHAEVSADSYVELNKTYGGTGSDFALALAQTTDGGYALAGRTYSFGAGSSDIWLVKTDASGNHLWNRTYGGTRDDRTSAFIQTTDGGFALAGTTYSFGAGSSDIWLVKTDANGNHLWDKTYGGTREDDPAHFVVQTVDGGYALAGRTYSFGAGSSDIWLVKTDASGNHLWNRTYGGMNVDGVFAFVQTVDGGYALAGHTYSFGAGNCDFWLVKTDSTGNMVWNRTYGGTGEDWAYALVQTFDEGYALVGETLSFGAGESDVWLVRTDALGNHLWNRTYGGMNVDGVFAFVQTVDGGYALAGHTYSFGAGSSDAWLVKISADGNHEWNETYGGIDEDYACRLVPTGNDGFVLAGGTKSFGAGSDDFWLVKTMGQESRITVPDDYSTIQEAINNAADGDTILVRNGTYYEHVIVDKTLSLIGDGSNTTIIDGNLTGNVVRITQDHVNIRGFTVQRSGRAYTNSGIYVGSTRYCDISANYIVDNEYGVHGSPRNMSVTDNTIEGNFLGVDLQSGSTGNVISRNHLVANYVSVHLNLADANYILQNNMTNNWRSVTLWESKNNTLYHNNFLNSTEQILVSPYANFFDNGFEGNYWSEYNGTDLNHDGIGDVPYIIDVNNADNYPLMDPWSASTGWTVDDDGPADFSKIQEAINAASDGDSIFVKAGTYSEHVVVNKTVTLVGENVSTTIIDGSDTGHVVYIVQNNVSITGFTIRNSGHTHMPDLEAGICLNGTTGCIISDNHLVDNGFSGISLLYSQYNKIVRNSVNHTEWGGIHLLGSSQNVVSGNVVDNTTHEYGVGINGHASSHYNTITENVISNSRYGMFYHDSRYNSICRNNISAISVEGIWLQDAVSHNVVAENSLINCTVAIFLEGPNTNNTLSANFITGAEYGIEILNAQNNRIVNNTIVNNRAGSDSWCAGIRLEGGGYSQIHSNLISGNYYGVLLYSNSPYVSVYGNNISYNELGIRVASGGSGYLNVSNNIVMNNRGYGIGLTGFGSSSNNATITRNLIVNNSDGIALGQYSNYNTMSQNNISMNDCGLFIEYSTKNMIYSNNIVDNNQQANITSPSANAWDNGYPSGGNYWSDYDGADAYRGSYQNETGSDGIGDAPVMFDGNNTDRYPLMTPWTESSGPVGDINGDGKVDMKDVGYVARRFMSVHGDPLWDATADFNSDGKINMVDIGTVARHFGESRP